MRCVTTTSCSTSIPKNQGESFYSLKPNTFFTIFYSFKPNTFFTIFYSFKSNTFFTTFCRYKSIVLTTFKSKLETYHLAERDGVYRIHIVFQFQLSHQVVFFKNFDIVLSIIFVNDSSTFCSLCSLKIFFSMKCNNIFLSLTY